MSALDIITVIHNETNAGQVHFLRSDIEQHLHVPYTFEIEDNRPINRGFGKACNDGSWKGSAPIIGFVNPDCRVRGPFFDAVMDGFSNGHSLTVITGSRFGKPQGEVAAWGLTDWVCGACFFVRRWWFEKVGGFDERYEWSWEETDLCRQAEYQGYRVKSIDLPIEHKSPELNLVIINGQMIIPEDLEYKRYWLLRGGEFYERKWGRAHQGSTHPRRTTA